MNQQFPLPGGEEPIEDSEAWWERFRSLLDDQNEWPSVYVFKFIVPAERLDDMKDVFEGHPVRERASSKGTYVSVTARIRVESSDEVVAYYTEAGKVEGVMAL